MSSALSDRCRPPRSRGFSLLELLVALAIMGLSMGLLYRASGGAARGSAEVELQQRAVTVMESLLAWRDAVPPEGWHEAGVSGGFNWRVDSQPWPESLNDTRAAPLHQVVLTVSWADGERTRSLETVTLLPQRKPTLPGGG